MKTADLFVTGVNGWLRTEAVGASRVGDIRKSLDDYKTVIAGLHLPVDDSRNVNASKGYAHMNRFKAGQAYWDAFAEYPGDDAASGRMLFAAMMRLSGTRRQRAYLAATDAEHYRVVRQRLATLPLKIIATEFSLAVQHVYPTDTPHNLPATAELGVPELRKLADDTIAQEVDSLEIIRLSARRGLDTGDNLDKALQANARTEQSVLSYATHMVIFAAGLRGGDIGNVPVLEPRSIADVPKVIYPFQENFWNNYEPSPVPER